MPFRRSPPNSVRAITWPKPSSRPERSKRPPKTTAQPWRRTRIPSALLPGRSPAPDRSARKGRRKLPRSPGDGPEIRRRRIGMGARAGAPGEPGRCRRAFPPGRSARSPLSRFAARIGAALRRRPPALGRHRHLPRVPRESRGGETPGRVAGGQSAVRRRHTAARAAIPKGPHACQSSGARGGLSVHRTVRQGAAAARKSRRRRALQLLRAHDLRARPAGPEAVRRRRGPVQPGRPDQTGRSQDLDRTGRHALSGPRLRAFPGSLRPGPPVGRRYSRDMVPARPHARQFETVEARARSLPALSRAERRQEPRPGIPGAPAGTNPKNRAGEELMRIGFLPAALALLLVPAGVLRADLKRAMAEPNLEKRSGLALDNAAAALKAAREAYDKNDSDLTAKDAAEIQESVDLAYDSLVQSGKNPRNSSWCKKAEISTRDLSRRLESFQEQMSYSDRPMLDAVKAGVQKVHDDLLMSVMEGRKKKK